MVFLSLKSNGLSLFEVCRSFSVWSLPIFYCLKSINLFLFEVCGSFSVWSLPIFYSVKSTIFLLFEVYRSFSVWYQSLTVESLPVFFCLIRVFYCWKSPGLSLCCNALAFGSNEAATLQAFYMEYHLRHSDSLKLSGWLTSQTTLSFQSIHISI